MTILQEDPLPSLLSLLKSALRQKNPMFLQKYKQVPTHCLLLFAIEAGDFLDLLKISQATLQNRP